MIDNQLKGIYKIAGYCWIEILIYNKNEAYIMAIDLTKTTPYSGTINTQHHIIESIVLDRNTETVRVNLLSYLSDTEYDNDSQPLHRDMFTFAFADVPASVTSKMVELRDIIELEMINNLPDWSGGTQVND